MVNLRERLEETLESSQEVALKELLILHSNIHLRKKERKLLVLMHITYFMVINFFEACLAKLAVNFPISVLIF